jgi:hypothetical protein
MPVIRRKLPTPPVKQPAVGIWPPDDSQNVTLRDKEGYSTQIGKTDLVVPTTGRKEQTPAASIVLFDKDKRVLWSAP